MQIACTCTCTNIGNMFKDSTYGISVFGKLDTRRALKNGLYPVRVQVCYKRKQQYYNTGIDLSKEDWDKLPNSKSRKFIDIKAKIKNSVDLVREVVDSLAENRGFSFDALNNLLGKGVHETINVAFKSKIKLLRQNDQIGTAISYENTLMNIEKFAGDKIPFDSISIDWLRKFEQFILNKGNSMATVGYKMRELRAILNAAKEVGIIKESQFPFGINKYQIKSVQGRKKALTVEELKKVLNYSDGTETTEKYIDLWSFLFYGNGINVADMIQLKYSNVVDGEICFIRQKTKRTNSTVKEIKIVILEEIKRIITKWGNPENPENFIFPFLSGNPSPEDVHKTKNDITSRINRRMRKIGKELKIEGLSTYVARHSYATILQNKGVPVSLISKNLGHSDIKTTENYLAGFEKDQRVETAQMLTNLI